MNNIAVIITNDFEDIEYTEPAKAFKNAGHRLTHVGLNRGDVVKGKKHGSEVKIDEAVKGARVDDFDALLIPGGYSPDKLRIDENAVAFVREFVESGKPIFAICHGPQILISGQALRGRKVTGWKSIIQDIKDAGAEFVDQAVVEDGNFLTSRGPDDVPRFVEAALRKLSTLERHKKPSEPLRAAAGA
jgi:protease I